MNIKYPNLLIICGYPIFDIQLFKKWRLFGYLNLKILIFEFISDIQMFESNILSKLECKSDIKLSHRIS